MSTIGAPADGLRSIHRSIPPYLSMLVLLGVAACAPSEESVQLEEGAEAVGAKSADKTPVVNVDRSLIITDLPTLEAKDSRGNFIFSLERVLNQLAATSGPNPGGLDAAKLYQRIFDTNNTKAGGFVPDGQHCDDQKDAIGRAVLNGVPIDCPRQEGALADLSKHNPFCSGPGCDPYTPLALVNRFDLAPSNGQNCGQYRMIFAKGFQRSPLETAGNQLIGNRNLLIFESVLPNPKPHQGLKGCSKLVQFWAGLTEMNDAAKRAEELDRFFFKGVGGFAAALRWEHFSGDWDPQTGEFLSGQIRANQFLNDQAGGGLGQPWQLREYHLRRSCSGNGPKQNCKPDVRMDPTLVNPDARLFDDTNLSALALSFRDPNNPKGFISQIPELARADLNRLNMNKLGREYNSGQSTSQPSLVAGGPPVVNDTNYSLFFNANGAFAQRIQTKLNAIKSTLTPTQIVRRAQSQACGGCHQLSSSTASIFGGNAQANQIGGGFVWPDLAPGPEIAPGVRPLAFVQVSDAVLVPLATGVNCNTACTAEPATCQCAWAVSPALLNGFLPYRRDNMLEYLKGLVPGNSPPGRDRDDDGDSGGHDPGF
ncbi:hypothetical protein [Polyangium sp. 6x1]|uniref:hypothetical protein n=1 Tax=Polyangium sp. 6x1 TaxID=3042689 RepID=UPI0024824CAA|nr:hypothetical protein [Polyangium sp. 6x1]MDI1444511.1 hypothetical protein [Polyangium sp. 6x1]